MWTIAHYYSREQHAPVAWSRFNVNFTLTLLYLALMVLNAAPFIAWIQNFQLVFICFYSMLYFDHSDLYCHRK